jgi:phosphoribosyl-AMP cyclohydrolase
MSDPREEGTARDIRWNADGLAPVIVQEATTGEVVMLAWMNAEALERTLTSGKATYWSRSRAAFWVKGETSGHHQAVVELRVDCDQDALLLRVHQTGPACHTGRSGCFYRQVTPEGLRFITAD